MIALEKLKLAIARHDDYGAQGDESPVYILSNGDGSFYELVPNETGDQLTLGDLRAIVSQYAPDPEP